MTIRNNFTDLFHRVLNFLTKEEITYVVIGGMAVDIWGRPRKTLDIDIVVRLGPERYQDFLNLAQKHKLSLIRTKALTQLNKMGMCRLRYGPYHADFIMGYSDFERVIFERKRKVTIFGQNIWVASPEDIILYKLLSARAIDWADMQNIVQSQGDKLDKKYLRKRARIMQKELLRTDIVSNLIKVMNTIQR
jgi:hypothetical protein